MSAITSTRTRSRGSGERPRPTRRPAAAKSAASPPTSAQPSSPPASARAAPDAASSARKPPSPRLGRRCDRRPAVPPCLRRSEVAAPLLGRRRFPRRRRRRSHRPLLEVRPDRGRADVRRLVGGCAAAVRTNPCWPLLLANRLMTCLKRSSRSFSLRLAWSASLFLLRLSFLDQPTL